jgi:Protein of unknown function (DUF3667)
MTEPWTCPTCASTVSTPYCPSCGECPVRDRELTFRGLVEQVAQAFTSIDGRLLRSVRRLIGSPGFLTMAYVQGRRKPYVGPVPLFLSANVLFFAVESLTGGAVFSTPLNSHLHTQPWSVFAESLVSHRLETMRTTLDLYRPVFDHAVALNARLLIIFMALSFAPVPSIVFHRSGRPLVVHALFSLHLYAFMLLLFCVATTLPPMKVLSGAGLTSDGLDHALSIALLVACAVYLHIATRVVYGASGAIRIVKVLALTVGVAGIVLGYRFVLFLITLYST